MLGLELSGATFGVVGLGRIGSRYAELVSGFGGRTLYVAPVPKPEAENELGASRVSLEELLAESDVVSLHAPATPETEHMISTVELDAMKSHAVLVNTARGSLVDSEALAKALADSVIGAAGLDVYEHEPGVPRHLLDAPRCVLFRMSVPRRPRRATQWRRWSRTTCWPSLTGRSRRTEWSRPPRTDLSQFLDRRGLLP